MNPHARIGDAEREQTVAALQRYAADGYLSLDEFSNRSAAAYRATTIGELAALTEDLVPRADPEHNRDRDSRASAARFWSPLVIAAVVLVGVVVLAVVVIVVMMLAMMGGMGMGGMG